MTAMAIRLFSFLHMRLAQRQAWALDPFCFDFLDILDGAALFRCSHGIKCSGSLHIMMLVPHALQLGWGTYRCAQPFYLQTKCCSYCLKCQSTAHGPGGAAEYQTDLFRPNLRSVIVFYTLMHILAGCSAFCRCCIVTPVFSPLSGWAAVWSSLAQ